MSQSEPGTREDDESTARAATAADGDEAVDDAPADPREDAEEPDVEEDLFEEELRIDGICGVY